jgi:hypothetical protein
MTRARMSDGQTGRTVKFTGPTRLSIDPKRMRNFCVTDKVCYETYEQAWAAAEQMMTEGRVDPGCHQVPVPCRECRYHHVANKRVVFLDDYEPLS